MRKVKISWKTRLAVIGFALKGWAYVPPVSGEVACICPRSAVATCLVAMAGEKAVELDAVEYRRSEDSSDWFFVSLRRPWLYGDPALAGNTEVRNYSISLGPLAEEWLNLEHVHGRRG